MDRNKIIYFFLLISFVVFVLILDISFYLKNSSVKGSVQVNRKFYEINLIKENNVVNMVNDTLNVVSNGKDRISFDLYNSGNVNAYLSEYSIFGITSNLEEEDIVIESSLKKNDVIKSGQIKRVYLDISCEECIITDNTEIKFSVRYLFKE